MLNRIAAISALCEGKTVAHTSFPGDQTVRQSRNPGDYVWGDGTTVNKLVFWAHRRAEIFEEGWSEVKDGDNS